MLIGIINLITGTWIKRWVVVVVVVVVLGQDLSKLSQAHTGGHTDPPHHHNAGQYTVYVGDRTKDLLRP